MNNMTGAKYLKIFCLILILTAKCKSQITLVQASLYSETGQTGDVFYTKDYIADLESWDFAGKVQSVCVSGLWFFYEYDDFDSGGFGDYLFLAGDNVCQNLPDNLAQNILSLRQAGSPLSTRSSTLTLFAYSEYRGKEVYLTRDWTNLGLFKDQSYSAVVTGPDSWTVYTYENYQGAGTCLMPNETVTFGGEAVQYGLFPTYHELGSSGSIRSAKIGCSLGLI